MVTLQKHILDGTVYKDDVAPKKIKLKKKKTKRSPLRN